MTGMHVKKDKLLDKHVSPEKKTKQKTNGK